MVSRFATKCLSTVEFDITGKMVSIKASQWYRCRYCKHGVFESFWDDLQSCDNPNEDGIELRKNLTLWPNKSETKWKLGKIPSRELTYPYISHLGKRMEKENHLQKRLGMGYVSSQEGMLEFSILKPKTSYLMSWESWIMINLSIPGYLLQEDDAASSPLNGWKRGAGVAKFPGYDESESK